METLIIIALIAALVLAVAALLVPTRSWLLPVSVVIIAGILLYQAVK